MIFSTEMTKLIEVRHIQVITLSHCARRSQPKKTLAL